jgi:hypothetical protein
MTLYVRFDVDVNTHVTPSNFPQTVLVFQYSYLWSPTHAKRDIYYNTISS